MHTKSIGLAWIAVKDFKKAVKFYTEVVGLKLIEMNEEWGWAELEGHECHSGMRLGIAQARIEGEDPVNPGQNAVMTFTIDNLDNAIKNMQSKGAHLIGEVEVIPGHVKMQGVRDIDGNFIQMVELLEDHHYDHGCCGGH